MGLGESGQLFHIGAECCHLRYQGQPACYCSAGVLVAVVRGYRGLAIDFRAWHQVTTRADARRVIIYGAGESGRQLLNALNHGTDYRVVAFIDDNPSLHETVINGRPVLGADELPSLVNEHVVRQVLLAIPSASQERRRAIINSLVGLPVRVRTIPKISELITGNAIVNQIQDVDLDDLLGREPVPPTP